MKCILSIAINQYKFFNIRYGEQNDRQFRVKEISIPQDFLYAYYCFPTRNLKAINHRNSEKLYYIKHPMNDWIEVIGRWLLQN